MTKILLIRHGHVEGINPERFRGRKPLELTALGRAEAQAVAGRVAASWKPSRIYTSPMGRCLATAAAIAQACNEAAVEICADLNDIDYGNWQFKTYDDAEAEEPALFGAWLATPDLIRFPNGESLQDVAARAGNALRLVRMSHPEETVVFVSHDSLIRVFLLQVLGLPLSSYWRIAQSPCSINEVDADGHGKICVLRLNETAHVEGLSP